MGLFTLILQIIIYVLCAAFAIIGGTLLYLGISLICSEKYDSAHAGAYAWLTITEGSMCILIPVLGVCGTIRKDRCKLNCFGIACAIVFICDIGYTIYCLRKYKEIGDSRYKFFESEFEDFKNYAFVRGHLFIFEVENQCCGIYSYHDYKKINKDVPGSCCADGSSPCNDPFWKPCGELLFEEYKKYYTKINIVRMVIFFVELFASVGAFILANWAQPRERRAEEAA